MTYVTQTRRHPDAPHGWLKNLSTGHTFDPAGGTFLNSSPYWNDEVTSSWRTGRNVEDSLDDNDAALLSSTQQADVFGHLRSEYKDRRQSSYDTGHTFTTTKRLMVCTPSLDTQWVQSGTRYRYVGQVYADATFYTPNYVSLPSVDDSYYGPHAIRATIPTKPTTNLAVGVSELAREGFPKMGMSLFNYLKRGVTLRGTGRVLSEEYLAWEFGLRPIIRDALSTIDSIVKTNEIMSQLQRDSGKFVHRRFEFPIERDTWDYPTDTGRLAAISSSSSTVNNAWVGAVRTGPQIRSVTTSKKLWFSGAFTFFVPQAIDYESQAAYWAQKYQLLYGYQATPEAFWNLSPWSWLSDWTNNIGTNIANATQFQSDGLVMKYGYLMAETTSDHSIVLNGPVLKSNGFKGPYTTIWRQNRKRRYKATPYGFALNPNAFTTRQWAILSALGFTKGEKALQ